MITEWEAASVLDLKMPLPALARTLDLNPARQQVAARFITEPQVSWEARGAAMLGEYTGYTSAMVARLQGISRDAAEWRDFGDTYMRVLALLQLDTTELHGIWPCTSGGEASFRSVWRYKIKKWSSIARGHSAITATNDLQMASRGDTVQEVKLYWCSLHDAMNALRPPSVVIAAAEAALKATATYWDFDETVAMEAVVSKCEERLPLTFGSPRMVALGALITLLSADATNAIWRHMKQKRVLATGGRHPAYRRLWESTKTWLKLTVHGMCTTGCDYNTTASAETARWRKPLSALRLRLPNSSQSSRPRQNMGSRALQCEWLTKLVTCGMVLGATLWPTRSKHNSLWMVGKRTW